MNNLTHDTALARYTQRRGQIETYFDRTAADAWARLTSTAPVSGIRATVRAGRDRMRATLLDWLPTDLRGMRLLDAGCGTGALAVEAAHRGAEVVAIDLSPTLVALARDRTPELRNGGRIEFHSGDMLDPALGCFDHVVGMDSLIHYNRDDVVRVLGGLAQRTRCAVLFTFAPGTPLLNTMIAVGRLFPRGDRAPSIEPVAEHRLRALIAATPDLQSFEPGRSLRVSSGFYKSHAFELVRRQA
ncbi:MAG: magnesium protoporphyrin IX methyltransferase [Betaproteobacteria bacterium HGW-Betaproteobacteria-3]|jgi:magnesium-protoporphyrin O-methyltransferase|nr:MAG: magnesium protoporphyrin IX methyltransferase [Betaproteobacteria bacterium HGW-Betaproteobacteria-3]